MGPPATCAPSGTPAACVQERQRQTGGRATHETEIPRVCRTRVVDRFSQASAPCGVAFIKAVFSLTLPSAWRGQTTFIPNLLPPKFSSTMLIPVDVQERHLDLFLCMMDGFINEASPDTLRPYVSRDLTEEELQQYCQQVRKPSQYPKVREFVQNAFNRASSASSRLFYLVMTVLSKRSLAFALTKSTKLIEEMSLEEKRQVFLLWRDSPIEAKNKIFALFSRLALSCFTLGAPDLHFKAMDFPQFETREQIYDGYLPTQFDFQMQAPPAQDNQELVLTDVDVVVIGSGSGAGVAAHTLARSGHKVLVLEKGKYFRPAEMTFDDGEGFRNLYELGGLISTENSQMILLAGLTFGGGSTVNWSACLKPQFKVRQEWYSDHGVEFVASEDYDACLDYVMQQMGASTDHIEHSLLNQVILDGAEKLDYKHKEIPQNTGGHENHLCGFCHLGCKWGIKQGSADLWLKDAAQHGAQFMDQVLVQKILRNKHNVAIGLQCLNEQNGQRFTISGAKKYVLSGGSLNTPILLQKSGFKNKHIGHNLKLHPITTAFAVWDQPKTDPFNHSIMTAVCTELEDLDGHAHGCKVETLVHTPAIEAAFLPWQSSDQSRQDLLKYQSMSAFIMLTRDTSSGSVTYDKIKDTLKVDYVINQFDRDNMNKAILIAMDMAYIEGAIELIHPHGKVGRFRSTRPKHERHISDADYQKYRQHCANTPLTSYGAGYGSAHQMSSCRMSGKGPADGACDVRGRLFECDNVYVADASVMPTASGANPMISTMAFARHIALGLCRDLAKPKM